MCATVESHYWLYIDCAGEHKLTVSHDYDQTAIKSLTAPHFLETKAICGYHSGRIVIWNLPDKSIVFQDDRAHCLTL